MNSLLLSISRFYTHANTNKTKKGQSKALLKPPAMWYSTVKYLKVIIFWKGTNIWGRVIYLPDQQQIRILDSFYSSFPNSI